MYTYRYIILTFSDYDGSFSIVCSPAPSSFVLWLGTSDISLKKVQVASILDVS